MSYPIPQITYDPGSGLITLPFTCPPIQKAGADLTGADEYDAQRTDSVTSSGLVQSVIDRVDTYRTLTLSFVPDADIPAWSAFMLWAIQGFTFNFFPDATDTDTHFLCTIAGTNWTPKWAFFQMKQFTLKLRLAAEGQDAGTGEDPGGGDTEPITLNVVSPSPGDFSVAHGLGAVPTAVIPVVTADGLMRLQATGWDASNVYLSASAGGLTALVYVFP